MSKPLAFPTKGGLWVIHLAFLSAVPIYAALLPGMIRSEEPLMSLPPVVAYLLPAVALLLIPLGFFLPPFLTKPRPDDSEKGITPQARRTISLVVGDSIFEAIAIYGLVGALLGTPVWLCHSLMGVSFLLLLANAVLLRTWTAES